MKIVFLGVGEATSIAPNTSILVESKTTLLLDCGFSAPMQLWKYNPKPDFLDGVFISHQHGDHILGLPALLLRMWQDGRKKKLAIICSPHVQNIIEHLMNTHYKSVLTEPRFPVDFLPTARQAFRNMQLDFAQSTHGEENHAIRISSGKKSVCYSGDGMFNEATMRLYRGADLVIHEAYTLNERKPGHATIVDLVSLFGECTIKKMALVHLHKSARDREVRGFIRKSKLAMFTPKAMDTLTL